VTAQEFTFRIGRGTSATRQLEAQIERHRGWLPIDESPVLPALTEALSYSAGVGA
jgi:hypothetical protein